MVQQEWRQKIYNQNPNPRLVGCDRKGNFHGIHVFIPPHSRAYVTNQSYTTGAPKFKTENSNSTHLSDQSVNERDLSCKDQESINPANALSIHPSIAKAWTTFSGLSGEVYEGFNVMFVHKKSVGSYLISFILPMANANYVPIAAAEGFNVQAAPTLLKAHTLEVETKIIEPDAKLTPYDSHTVHVVVFGSLHPFYLQ